MPGGVYWGEAATSTFVRLARDSGHENRPTSGRRNRTNFGLSENSITLVSEARGEFLLVEGLRRSLARRGVPTRHITALRSDLSNGEAEGVPELVVIDQQPEYREAALLGSSELSAAVEREQEALGLNLRRVWQADLRCWRERYPDERMARITLGTLASLRRVLDEARPAGLWGEDGGHLVKQLAYALCPHLGVRLLFLWAIPLPGRIIPYSNVLVTNDRTELARFEPSPDERAYADDLVEGLLAARIQYAIPRDMALRPRRVVNVTRLVMQSHLTRPPGAESLYVGRFARLYLSQRANAARLSRWYRPLGDRPFVFYPVHVAHDTQVAVRAHQWENQLALIEHIASSLPYGYELAIKEHPAQVGALGPDELGTLLRRRREVRLLDPNLHAHAVLPRCAAVTTINSTTGFESLVFGKPTVTFGHSPYRGLGLTFDVTDAFETPSLIAGALRSDGPAREDVVRYVAFLRHRSSPGFPLSDDSSELNVENYAAHLAREVGGFEPESAEADRDAPRRAW